MPVIADVLSYEMIRDLSSDSALDLLNLDCVKHIGYVGKSVTEILFSAYYKKDLTVQNEILINIKLPEWAVESIMEENLYYYRDVDTLKIIFQSINKPVLTEKHFYEASGANNLEAFQFFLEQLEEKNNFVTDHSLEIFRSANRMMDEEEGFNFRPEFLTFIAQKLRDVLGIKIALKECVRGSINFGGYHCCKDEFFSAVLEAFPEIHISAEKMLQELRNERNFYLTEDKEGKFILDDANTEKCIGEILRVEGVECYV